MGIEIRDKVKSYQYYTDESPNDYPTKCPEGSCMELIDKTTNEVVGYKIYDGTNWNNL